MRSLHRLSRRVVALATALGLTLGTAESLTAGLVASSIASVPGASKVLMGGIVSYDSRVKRALLGVSREILDGPGVVSAACARQMALGARAGLAVDMAVSATGLAGPAGGTEETPVGTVFIGLADGKAAQTAEYHFTGRRQSVRKKAAGAALQMLLERMQTQSSNPKA